MKNTIPNRIIILIFLILLFAPTLLYFVIGENTEAVLDEKRTLTEMPDHFSNDYFPQIENWYNDHAPYRISLITYQMEGTQLYSVFFRNRIRPLLSSLMTPYWYNDEYKQWTGLDLPYLVPMEDYLVDYGRDDWLFYGGENSVGFFRGTNLLAPDEMEKWKDSFLALKDLCSKKGIELVFLVPPNKEQVYPEYMASYRIENLPKREEIIYQYMKENGLPFIYPLESLKAYKDQYRVYQQQDSHWNDVGGYIAFSKIFEALGKQTIPVNDLQVNTFIRTGGDISNFCGYATDYTDYKVTYKPEINYTVETYNDGNIEIFHSDSKNEQKIVLIGDSMRDYNKDYFAKEFSKAVVLFRTDLEDPVVTNELLSLKEGDALVLQIGERHDEAMYNVTNYLLSLLGK